MGLSRSTTGCVAACIFREFQLSASYEGLIETVPGINLEVLRMDKYVHEKEKDALFRGEFEVVKELMAELEDGAVSSINFCKEFFHSILADRCGQIIKYFQWSLAKN